MQLSSSATEPVGHRRSASKGLLLRISVTLLVGLIWLILMRFNSRDPICQAERHFYHAPGGLERDAWGRPYGSKEVPFGAITFSLGPNGVSGDADDIVLVAPNPPPYFVYSTRFRILTEQCLLSATLSAAVFLCLMVIPVPTGRAVRWAQVAVGAIALTLPFIHAAQGLVQRPDLPAVTVPGVGVVGPSEFIASVLVLTLLLSHLGVGPLTVESPSRSQA